MAGIALHMAPTKPVTPDLIRGPAALVHAMPEVGKAGPRVKLGVTEEREGRNCPLLGGFSPSALHARVGRETI